MSMTRHPEGTTRVRRGGVKHDEQGRIIRPDAFEIFYETLPGIKVKVGETERTAGGWRPVSPYGPSPDPFRRHNDAMAWLKDQYRETGKDDQPGLAPDAESASELPVNEGIPSGVPPFPAQRVEGGRFAESESVLVIPVGEEPDTQQPLYLGRDETELSAGR